MNRLPLLGTFPSARRRWGSPGWVPCESEGNFQPPLLSLPGQAFQGFKVRLRGSVEQARGSSQLSLATLAALAGQVGRRSIGLFNSGAVLDPVGL